MADPIIKCQSCGTEHTYQEIIARRECKNCGHPEFGTYRPEGADEICDFCSTPKPTLVYACRDFRQETPAGMPDWGSMGWWACCTDCSALIEASDRDALAKRSYETMPNRAEVEKLLPQSYLMAEIRKMHDNFWANRQGAPFENLEVPDGNR